jgi:hypothetical protein
MIYLGLIVVVDISWNKPVLSFYRENNEQPETEAFAVVKAKKIEISKPESGPLSGKINDFFCLMGDIDNISPASRYVVCWFDDQVEDFYKAFRRLSGVTFPSELHYVADDKGKRTYNTEFQAKHSKLK